MNDAGGDPDRGSKIKLIFKKKNLGEWESFITKENPQDSNDDEIHEGKVFNSDGLASCGSLRPENTDISEQLHLMHVTNECNPIHSTEAKQEVQSNGSTLFKKSLPPEQRYLSTEDAKHHCSPVTKHYYSNLDLAKDAKELDCYSISERTVSLTDVKVPNNILDLSCFNINRRNSLDDALLGPNVFNDPQSTKTCNILIDRITYKSDKVQQVESGPNPHGGLCKGQNLSLLPEFGDPSNHPRPPSQPAGEETSLWPVFPAVQVAGFDQAHSKSLEEFCLKQHCCIIKGVCRATQTRLEVFSTASLRRTFGDYNMEIRVQKKFRTLKSGRRLWNFQSKPSSMTINQFAKYQALSFMRATSGNNSKPAKSLLRKEIIHFGTNVDFSNPEIWKEQLDELEKLPDFLKVHCPNINLLNHIGHNVLGVNTVQLYMKVPGCRTPGHQENNNFSAINVNVGPGLCEWFCVAEDYWGTVYDLCKENGLNYSSGSWWPDLKDLSSRNVPVYRVIQEPGDVIWIGPGTIHWVQSLGWCNNVAWNVGPMSEWQFKSAIERYEYNKLDPPYKSIVPMVQLSWNVAQWFIKQHSPRFSININLAERIFRVVSASLRYCKEVLIKIQKLGKRSVRQDRLPTDLAHYCEVCLNEVFNIIFAYKSLVHCFGCAVKKSNCLKDFYVLEEYSLDSLQTIVDEFATKMVTVSNQDEKEK